MSDEAEALAYRPFTAQDLPFIQSSWGNAYYKGSNYHKWLSPEVFHHFHRPLRERFFMRPWAEITLCVSKEDPTLIVGWIASEPPRNAQGRIIHFLYVKQAFKEEKIATKLLEMTIPKTGPIFFTHQTDRARRIMERAPDKYNMFIYAPHLV